MRVPFSELHAVLLDALRRTGMEEERADHCARLFAEASRDGVSSHGLNRFPRFLRAIGRGVVDVHARARCVGGHGASSGWTGAAGPVT